MKKLSLLLALALGFVAVQAAPVDVNMARSYGQKFVWNTLGQKSATLSLAYTQKSESGVDALYIFNYDHGYVVVPADDRAHPILGYCEDLPFDSENIPDGLKYYLGYYARQIQYAIDNDLPMDTEIADQWYYLGKEGVMSKTRLEKAVSPLLTTTWDQGWPYNYYAPACNSYWTNNHCYAGCVATAMSQVMKFWNWPDTGVGEHSYNTSSYPGNGATLSANFGETTYEWSIMPNSVSSANAGGLAVALLMYHCGIAVNMDYSPNGSGAQTGDAVDAVKEHFKYASCTDILYRDYYTRTEWEDMLIESFDKGIPVIYAGQGNDGGHAFNCDGYNDQRMFHFNWGWSGQYNNTYYQIDALNTGNGTFNTYQRFIKDMIPDYIYEAKVPAMSSLEAVVDNAITKTVNLSWTAPETSVTGQPLTAIQRIVLKRDGVDIQVFDSVQPGSVIEITDEVDEYGAYVYSVAGYNYDLEGVEFSKVVVVGPSCTWKFVCQTNNFQGWNGGKLRAVGANGTIFKEIKMTSSSPLSEKVKFPEGDFSLQWVAPGEEVSSLSITLKNSANESVYSYSGSSAQLNGTLFSGTNDCPNCTPPTELTGTVVENGAKLTWVCDYTPSKFKIYRSEDGESYEEIGNVGGDVHEYVDQVEGVTYYYKVTVYSSACESNPALTPDETTDFVVVTVPMAVAENNIKARLYPNPTTGELNIEASALSSVTVYNLVGQKVYEESVQGEKCLVNMKSFGCGMYLVNVVTANGSIVRKVTVIE